MRRLGMALVATAMMLSLNFGAAMAADPPSPAPSASPGAVVTRNDVNGTIKNWQADSFELQGPKGRPWKFKYDKNTKISGTAANGAKAEVLFMDQKGKHVAKEVTISR